MHDRDREPSGEGLTRRELMFPWRIRSTNTGEPLSEKQNDLPKQDEIELKPIVNSPQRERQRSSPIIPRRAFLALLGAGGVSFGAAALLEKFGWLGRFVPEKRESKERLDHTPRNILVIDFPTGNGEGIPEDGLVDYAAIEESAFADMPDRFLSREELVVRLNEELQPSRPLEVSNLENPSPLLLRDIAELGYPELATWYAFLKRFRTHGQMVADAAETSWEVTRENGAQRLLSLGEFLSQDLIDFQQDHWGNTGLTIQLRAEQVIPRIEQYLQEHPEFLDEGVVNLSLQMGSIESWVGFQTADEMFPNQPTLRNYYVGDLEMSLILPRADIQNVSSPFLTIVSEDNGRYVVRYDDPDFPEFTKEYTAFLKEDAQTAFDAADQARDLYRREYADEAQNPGTHDVGAYTGERRAENIQELVDVAQAFPELFFCAAAGNNADDLTNLQEIGVEIPQNLITVGQWSTTMQPPRPAFETIGAEIYIENDVPAELLDGDVGEEVELGNGSSFSTPQISGIVSTLRGLGIPLEQVKPLLIEMAEVKRFPVDSSQESDEPSMEARVLSLQRVQEVIIELRTRQIAG